MLLRPVVVALVASAPSWAADDVTLESRSAEPSPLEAASETAPDTIPDTIPDAVPPSDPLTRLWPALAAAGTSALLSIPLSAAAGAGATGVCLYTLGIGGLVGLPCALTPLACGACGGAAGTLVGLWLAGDDLWQPLSVISGAGVGLVGGALGLVVGGGVTLVAWQPIGEAYGQPGDLLSYVDELALIGAVIVGVSTALTLALAGAAVGGFVALLPARPAPSGDVVVEHRTRMAAQAPSRAPGSAADDVAIAY